MEKYRISVLMGIFNCSSTLQVALDSLYVQTYQGFKIILCDDGSKDDTLKIAEENARLHDNVVVIKNPKNMGLNYTLNHCLEYADTEYIARMDGDDICDPTRFEKEIIFLDEHPQYAIVSTPMHYFDEEGIFRTGRRNGEVKLKNIPKSTPHCHAPCMVRTEAMKAVGGYSVAKRLIRVEDYHLWIKMYAAGYRGYNIDEPLYSMRDDRNAKSRRKWRNAYNNFYVKNLAVSMLHLPFWMRIYSLRQFLVKMLPEFIYNKLHKNKR